MFHLYWLLQEVLQHIRSKINKNLSLEMTDEYIPLQTILTTTHIPDTRKVSVVSSALELIPGNSSKCVHI